uniref:Putative sorting nexin lst-4 n=1 Tax=Lutzomyia longipalpis TaxID=7200 RepID=A0A1B0GLE2_LUTLO
MFSKSSDSYIMGITQVSVPENEKVSILPVDHGFMWRHMKEAYTVTVASPKKETKFKGMKSFIAYQLTPSFNNISVSRRYKHFDWLHGRLVEKFSLIPIPPLPDKQISGRYEEQFIEHRRVQLQEFVDWMYEKKWKIGKRTAEKDPLVGAVYCAAIVAPEKQLLQSQVDMQVDTCGNFVHQMDSAVKTLSIIATEQTKKYQMQWKRIISESARASQLVCILASGNCLEIKRSTTGFHCRIAYTSTRGVLGAFPDILSEHKNAMAKKRDCEKLTGDQKMSNAQLQEVNRRTDVMSYALMAELSHFRTERDEHLKGTLREFIDAQIAFYQTIVSRLQAAKQFFE